MQKKIKNSDFGFEKKTSSEMTIFEGSTVATLFSLKLRPVNFDCEESMEKEEKCNLCEEIEGITQPLPRKSMPKTVK